MASGHVNRIKRPDTWLHRPMLQNVKKVLANPEPSTHGTKRTWPDVRLESAFRGRAEVEFVAGGAAGLCPRVRLGGFLGDPGKGTNPARALISYIQSRQRINASDVKQFTF